MNNSPIGESWSSYRKRAFTSEELAASDRKVEMMKMVMEAQEKGAVNKEDIDSISKFIDYLASVGSILRPAQPTTV